MSRSKKTRKQGKLTTFLPTGPSKTELLADPDSRESRRKKALEQKRRQQRSVKKDAGEGADTAATKTTAKKRQPRLKKDPAAVAEASRQLMEKKTEQKSEGSEG